MDNSTPWSQFPWIGKNTADSYGCTSQYSLPMSSRTQPPDASMVSAFSNTGASGSGVASNPYMVPSQSFSHNHSASHYPSSLSSSCPVVSENSVTNANATSSPPSLKPHTSVLGMAWSQFPWISKTASDTYGSIPQYGFSAPQKSLGMDSSSLHCEVSTPNIDMSSPYTLPPQEGISTPYLTASQQLSTSNPTSTSINFNSSEAASSVGSVTTSTATVAKPCPNTSDFLSPLSTAINSFPTAGHLQGSSQHNNTTSQFSKFMFFYCSYCITLLP